MTFFPFSNVYDFLFRFKAYKFLKDIVCLHSFYYSFYYSSNGPSNLETLHSNERGFVVYYRHWGLVMVSSPCFLCSLFLELCHLGVTPPDSLLPLLYPFLLFISLFFSFRGSPLTLPYYLSIEFKIFFLLWLEIPGDLFHTLYKWLKPSSQASVLVFFLKLFLFMDLCL